MAELRKADGAAVVYSDVLDHVECMNEFRQGLAWERKQLGQLAGGKQVLLKVPLFPYQVQGALFAASRGRIVLAYDMGLGRTVETSGRLRC